MIAATLVAALLVAPAVAAADGQLLERADRVLAVAAAPDGSASVLTTWGRELRLRRAGPREPFGLGTPLAFASDGFSADLAADGSGVALGDADGRVRAATFSADGAIGSVDELSPRGVAVALDVAPSGAALAVWFEELARGRAHAYASVREAGAVRFGRPQRVFRGIDRASGVEAAIGDRGDAVIAVGGSECAEPAFAALRRPGRPFGRAQLLDGGSSCFRHVAVGGDGTVVVAHIDGGRRGEYERFDLAIRRAPPRAGRLGRRRVLPGPVGFPVGIAVAPNGRVLLAADRRSRVDVWDAAPHAKLRRSATIGARFLSEEIGVDVDGAGRAVVLWAQDARRRREIVARERAVAALRASAGAPFHAPRPVFRRRFQAMPVGEAALAPGGGAIVAWEAFNSGDEASGGHDGAGITRLPAAQ